MEELNRAYDALQKAHEAGDVEGARKIAEYARSLELQQQKAPEAEAPAETPATMSIMGIEAPLAPMAGAVIGSSVGALASPAVSGAVDTAAVRAAQAVAPGSKVIPGDVTPQAVKNWLATQTSQPYAGGDTYSKANMKAKIAAGEPIQSRGSNVPIRKGNLGISNQPPPPTLAQQTATNLLNAEKAPAPGIARRVTGMGAMGAQTGNAINEFDKGNAGRGILSTLGALSAAASQSRIKPIRALGTIGSMAIPGIQMMLPEEPVPEMAAGGSVANVGSQMGMNVPFMGQELKNVGQAMAQRQYPEAALQSGSLAYSALAPINPLTAALSALGYSSEVGDATLEGYKKQQEQAARDREFEAYKRQQALQKKQKDDAFIQRFQAARPQKFDLGGKVKAGKKLLEGNFLKNYLPHTAKNQNPEVGSRFQTEDLGGLLPVTPVSMESIRGKMVGTIPWDNSSRNVKINSVSGIPLTQSQVTHGGQGWVRDIEHNAANIGGANAKGAATAIQNKINAASELGEKMGGSGEVVLSPGTGAKFSDNFSVPVFNVYKDLYDQAELPKTILQKHSDFLRNVPKTNPKTKEVSYPFSNAPDINSPEMKEFALQNPNFRKQFLMEMQKPRSEKLLGYNTDDIYNAMTDPNLRDVPAGYMGHTLINVKKDAPVTPSSNSTYAYNMYGNYGGSLEHTPNEVFLNKAYNDNFNILRQKYPNAPEKKIHDMALGALDKRGEGVFELMNDEAINRIGQYHEGLKQGKFDSSDYRGALDYLKTPGVYAEGGEVQHMQSGGSPKQKAISSGLEALLNKIKSEGRTPVVPVPNRWFSQPEKFPHVQGMVNKTLENSQLPREAFHSGAFIDPRTGQILDRNIYNDVGVLIDPQTGRPMMSAGKQSGIDILDPKTGSYTKSNLVRQSLFKPTGGDPMLADLPFIATIEKGDMGHKYALGTEYATPTEMYNTMTGANPTLRPRSRGDVFGMGDVVGQVQVGGRGIPHDVYEKLFVAPKGSDVPGVKLNKAAGGKIVKGALDALNKASDGKLGQVANKDLTTLQDYHTSLGDRVAAGAKEMQDKIAAAQFRYKKGDRVFTDWTAKNNYPPYEILGTRILGGKFGTILRDPATGKALRDENGKALREAEHVGYQVRHDFTPHGETEPSWRIHTMPETSFKGLIEPEEPYKKGGKVKKK